MSCSVTVCHFVHLPLVRHTIFVPCSGTCDTKLLSQTHRDTAESSHTPRKWGPSPLPKKHRDTVQISDPPRKWGPPPPPKQRPCSQEPSTVPVSAMTTEASTEHRDLSCDPKYPQDVNSLLDLLERYNTNIRSIVFSQEVKKAAQEKDEACSELLQQTATAIENAYIVLERLKEYLPRISSEQAISLRGDIQEIHQHLRTFSRHIGTLEDMLLTANIINPYAGQ